MVNKRKEAVTVSFHYLVRHRENDAGETENVAFSNAEFAKLAEDLQAIGNVDLDDDNIKNRVYAKRLVPIEDVSFTSPNIIFGLYRAAYWGHSYTNTVVGKIPADSISLRPFYFIIYLSKTGKLYIGVQYLGLFGSYEGLKNTIVSHLPASKSLIRN